MKGWDKTVQQIVREAHQQGAWDMLRAVLDAADHEPDHECQALEYARRLYSHPDLFDSFVRDSQSQREDPR